MIKLIPLKWDIGGGRPFARCEVFGLFEIHHSKRPGDFVLILNEELGAIALRESPEECIQAAEEFRLGKIMRILK